MVDNTYPEPVPAPAVPRPPLKQPVLLALDLGQRTGWAVRTADGAIAGGTAEFRPGRSEGGGMVYLCFRSWPQELRERVEGLERVLVEEVRAHRGVAAAHAYGGFLADLTAGCEDREVPDQGMPVGTIRRHITGTGNAAKDGVIAAVRTLGHQPAAADEVDAVALPHRASAQRHGGRR